MEESRSVRSRETVAGLGDEVTAARIGAAGLLPTFLDPRHEAFFRPVFKLASGYLKPTAEVAESSENLDVSRGALTPLAVVDPVRQMMASVLRQAYPLALVWSLRVASTRWTRLFTPDPRAW